ncbi:calcium-binding protein [Oryzomicrobium sp.]|uniref:calcium-binding protein n=1 Tax=Oryzomicrobium sp. TaxID=1911578 RepID=UPI0025D3DABB|nr:calcium-binding protein [Oryzomicrobium sp.]MCE1242905.1 hypothetical protein [Oryzomicrobium sp.]
MALAYQSYPEAANKQALPIPAGWDSLGESAEGSLGLTDTWNQQFGSNNKLENQFVVFVNEKEHQVVISFKGSDAGSNWQSDLLDAGAAEFAKIWPKAQEAYDLLSGKKPILNPDGTPVLDKNGMPVKSPYADWTFITAGHSLGGGMAQSFALRNGLDAYVYNSLPIANDTINGTALGNVVTDRTTGATTPKPFFASESDFQAKYDAWIGGNHHVYDVRTPNDIATFFYPTFGRGKYLSTMSGQAPDMLPGVEIPMQMKLALGLSILAGNAGALVSLASLTFEALDHMMGTLRDAALNVGLDTNGRFLRLPGQELLAQMPTLVRNQLSAIGAVSASNITEVGNGFVRLATSTGDYYIKYVQAGDTTGNPGDVIVQYDNLRKEMTCNVNRPGDGFSIVEYDASHNEVSRTKTILNAKDKLEVTEYWSKDDPAAHKTETRKLTPDGWQDTISGGSGQEKYVIATQGDLKGQQVLRDISPKGTICVGEKPLAPDVATLIHISTNIWQDSEGTLYRFQPGARNGVGTLMVSGGTLGTNTLEIDGFDLSAAQSDTGYAGIRLGSTKLAIEPGTCRATDAFSTSNDTPANVSASATGTLQTFTVVASAVSDKARQIVLALSDSAAGFASIFGINTGADYIPFGNGPITLTIPAGKDGVTVALVNTGDRSAAASAQLTATIVDPGAAVPASSNVFTVDFQANGLPSGGRPDHTIVGDLQPINYGSDTNPQYHMDEFGNLVVDPASPAPGRNDTLYGSSGNDLIQAGGGTNLVRATQGGNDTVEGQGGTGAIIAGSGNNALYGNARETFAQALERAGHGQATGQYGYLFAMGDGANTVVGGNGNDLVLTGGGNNLVILGPGNSTVLGGEHVVDAATDWNTLNQEAILTLNRINARPANTFVVPQGWSQQQYTHWLNGTPFGTSRDTIFGGSGTNLIRTSNGDNYVDAGTGNTSVYGGGGNDTIFGSSGNGVLWGGGGNDYIDGESGNHVIVGGQGDNTIYGGSGNDTIYAGDDGDNWDRAETGNNYVEGGSGNCLIFGSGGNDTLIAGSGNSTIYGGSGNEYIEGGSGHCELFSNSGTGKGGSGRDTMVAGDGDTTIHGGDGVDFIYGGTGVDVIYGGNGTQEIHSGNGGTAERPTQILVGSGTSTVYGGSGVLQVTGGSGSDTLIAGDGETTLTGGSGTEVMYAGAGRDLLIAGSGNDTLYGGTGEATLQGGSGDALLVAGEGATTLIGGTGQMTYQVDPGAGETVIKVAKAGDTLQFGGGITLDDINLIAALSDDGHPVLEIDLATGGTIWIVDGLIAAIDRFAFADGSVLSLKDLMQAANTGSGPRRGAQGSLILNAAGGGNLVAGSDNDTLVAFGANTTLTGGNGNDTFFINDTTDVIIAKAGGHNNVKTSVSYVTPDNVEMLVGTGTDALVLTGNALGGTVIGNTGHDTLVAGAGNATLIGNSGNDVFIVSKAADVVRAKAGGVNTVDTSVDYVAPENVQQLRGTGSQAIRLTGNGLDNLIVSNGANDTLVAGSGKATLVGGAGNDTFIVNNSADVVLEQEGNGFDTVLSSVDYVLPDHVEQLVLTGSNALTARGNATGGTIYANSGNDTLIGGTGNTTLVGGTGKDTFVLEAGTGATTVVDNSAAGAVVRLGFGVGLGDLSTQRDGNDLILTIRSTPSSMRLQGYYAGTSASWQIVDAQGVATTPDDLVQALGENSWLTNRKLDFFTSMRMGIIGMLEGQGFTQLANGSLYKAPNVPIAYNETIATDRVTTTLESLTANSSVVSSSSTTYSQYFVLNASYVYPAATIDGNYTLSIVDTKANIEQHQSLIGDSTYIDLPPIENNSTNSIAWMQLSWGQPHALGSSTTSQTCIDISPYTIVNGQPLFLGLITVNEISYAAYHATVTGLTETPPPGSDLYVSLPKALQTWFYHDTQTYNLNELDLTNGDHVVSANSYSAVIGGIGNNTIYNAGFAYGGIGNAHLSGGGTLIAGIGDQYLENGTTMIVGDGHDTVIAGAGDTIQVSAANTGMDILIGTAGNSFAVVNAIYQAHGIDQWQEAYEHAGQIHFYEIETFSEYFDSFAEGCAAYHQRWPWIDLQAIFESGLMTITTIDPLPFLIQIPGQELTPSSYYENAHLPTITLSGESFEALQPYLDTGVLVSPTVSFGEGITLANLKFSWGSINSPIDGISRITLDISWGNDQGVRILMPNFTDPLGSGIQSYVFSDGTKCSLTDLVSLAPPPPDFDPQFFHFERGSGTKAINTFNLPSITGISIGANLASSALAVQLDGHDLVIGEHEGSDTLRIPNWFDEQWCTAPAIIKFADGTYWDTQTINRMLNVVDGGAGNQVVNGIPGLPSMLLAGSNDTLIGGSHSDTYVYIAGSGEIHIVDQGGGTLQFGADITPDMISLGVGSCLLRIGDQGDMIHLDGFDPTHADQFASVQKFSFADGTVLTYSQLISRGFDIYGSSGDETLTGTNLDNRIYAGSGNDILIGSGRYDTLYGGAGQDTLIAGNGCDLLIAGSGDTTLVAGIGMDTLVAGSGIDTFVIDIADTTTVIDESTKYGNQGIGSDVIHITGQSNGIGAKNVGIDVAGRDVLFHIGETTQIRLQNYLDSAGSPLGRLEFDDGSSIVAESVGGGDYWFASYDRDGIKLGETIVAPANDSAPTAPANSLNRGSDPNKLEPQAFAFSSTTGGNTSLTAWQLADAQLTSHLANSENSAMGNDLTYYGMPGSLSSINIAASDMAIANTQFGKSPQAFLSSANLSNGGSQLL